jgi:hypothetical protein
MKRTSLLYRMEKLRIFRVVSRMASDV